MDSLPLDAQIEAVLFYKAAPVKHSLLMKLFGVDQASLNLAITSLKQRLTGGVSLIETDSALLLATAPAVDSLIEHLRKDEMKRDIGKAGAETLAIIVYRGPIARGEIDRIRGVNSSYILRNLLVRGLIEKGSNPKIVTYQATPALLAHVGITDRTQLPEFTEIMSTLDRFEQSVIENV